MNTTPLLEYWKARTLREQRMLLMMGSLLAIVIIWLLIVRPVNDAVSAARERHGAAVVDLAETRAKVEAIQAAEKEIPGPLTAPINTIVSQSAAEAGFVVDRLDGTSTADSTIIMKAVKPEAFFAWIARMQARGLSVRQMSAARNADQTLTVRTTFRAGGV